MGHRCTSLGQTPATAEAAPPLVKNVLADLTKPFALVKHSVDHLSTAPVQVIGPNAHRVALIFINPAQATIAVAPAPAPAEISAGTSLTMPPATRQTAILNESAQKPWTAIADRNADVDLLVWEVVR